MVAGANSWFCLVLLRFSVTFFSPKGLGNAPKSWTGSLYIEKHPYWSCLRLVEVVQSLVFHRGFWGYSFISLKMKSQSRSYWNIKSIWSVVKNGEVAGKYVCGKQQSSPTLVSSHPLCLMLCESGYHNKP